jgi:hypothetical protein
LALESRYVLRQIREVTQLTMSRSPCQTKRRLILFGFRNRQSQPKLSGFLPYSAMADFGAGLSLGAVSRVGTSLSKMTSGLIDMT